MILGTASLLFVSCYFFSTGAVGGDDDDGDTKEKEEEAERERQEAIREAEERRKEKHRKMEEEREKMRQEIRDKVSIHKKTEKNFFLTPLTITGQSRIPFITSRPPCFTRFIFFNFIF